ncbi:MAG: Hsp20/alpha crystallin family protein [Erysipelotrichaceae bacterium]|nr:Hsp20/alpha crystallin family protein [Erysipelotrichaceae bacterium]
MKYLPRTNGYGLDLFDDFFEMPSLRSVSRHDFMKTDIREVDNNYVMDIDMPGFAKENLNIELQDGYLTVSAKQNTSNEEKDSKGNIIHQERYTGSMSRSYYVGENVTEEDIKAAFKDGILTVTFPKEPKKIVEKKTISID